MLNICEKWVESRTTSIEVCVMDPGVKMKTKDFSKLCTYMVKTGKISSSTLVRGLERRLEVILRK